MEIESKTSGGSRIFVRTSRPIGKNAPDTKKVKGPDSQLYTSVCPVVYVIRVFGLAPYEFHDDMLVPSSINSIYSYVCLVGYTYIIWTVLVRFTAGEMEKPLLDHTETGKAACNYAIAVVDLLTTIFTKKKFVKIWNTMQDYDEVVKNLGYPRNERKTCLWAWIILCSSAAIWTAINQFGMMGFDEAWLQNVIYMIIYIGSSISIIKFSCMTLLLGQRFEHLNGIAKKSALSVSRWLLASPMVEIKDIEYLHNLLMMASENLNSLYSWPLLFWLGNLCFHVVSDLFFVTQRVLMWAWSLYEWKVLACLLSWIMAFIGQLIILNYSCHYASTEANIMGYVMISWRRWLKNSGIYRRRRYESTEMSLHLIIRRLDFSAAGCFNVNLPLLRSITGQLTTYLVILLQFPE